MNNILSKLKKQDDTLPPTVLLAAPEGFGKSSWGASAPNPLFICAENGLTNFPNIQSLRPATLEELNADLVSIHTDPCGFKSIVVDTVDWLERMIHAALCRRDGCENIEMYQKGYGKGYSASVTELASILKRLDDIRTKHKMWVILLSHVNIKAFNDPAGASYDRWEMKGNKQFTGLLREWPDACLFGTYEVFKMKEKGERVERAIGGERIVHTTWSPAHDAKNRLNLPETLPLDWHAFVEAVAENSPVMLLKRVEEAYKTAEIPEADKPKWATAMKQIKTVTPDRLKAALEKLTALQPKPQQ